MKPILGTTSGWARRDAVRQRAAAILILCVAWAAAGADTMDFMGVFAPSNWSSSLGSGVVYFTNSNTELALAGPNSTPPGSGTSIEGITYNGPLGGGLVVGGTLQFHWEYQNYGATTSPSGGELDLIPPGGGETIRVPLGEEGVSAGGDVSTFLLPGTTFTFYLTTTFPPGISDKLSADLHITQFQFHDVPEPSTGALVAGMLICLGTARWHNWRRPLSRQH
jgi:hypothetical protein